MNITTLIKTITAENGELHISGYSYSGLLAKCKLHVDIIQNESRPMSQFPDCPVIRTKVCITLCYDMDFKRRIDDELLSSIACFDIQMDIPLRDGTFERIVLKNAEPKGIAIGEDWKFEIKDPNIIRKLQTI